MNIFRDRRIVLVCPPKTGTTAIGQYAESPTPDNPSESWNRDTIPNEFKTWDAYLIVRHPITRALSLYAYWCKHEERPHPEWSLDYFIDRELFGDREFFCRSIHDRYGHLPVKGWIPQESLQVGLWSIGIRVRLDRVNVGATLNPSTDLTPSQILRINAWGKSDYEQYGYDPL